MKKVLFGVCAAVAVLAFVGCASTSGAAGATTADGKFVITENSGVVGYYTFEEEITESMEVVDHSGNDISVYTAALDGSELDEGHTGDGLYFNGNDEYITLDPSVLDGDGFTFAAWLNPEAWKVWARVLDIGNQKEDLWIGMDWQTRMLRMDVLGAAGAVSVLSPLPPIDEWTHLAATIDGSVAKLYINGKLTQRIPCRVKPAHIGANVQGIYVGASNWPDPLFQGVMDDVLVANRALSAGEIAAVYKGVVPFDEAE
ncbi:MAG: LamG domain-containing protein [Treponema sp.]|nr:LamG domain-containing protein [Treponema sp.]